MLARGHPMPPTPETEKNRPAKYRTSAFHIPRGEEVREVRFWTLEESFDRSGHYIREHIHTEEMFGDGAESRPVTEVMRERDAFARLLQLGEEYAGRFETVNDKDPRWAHLLGAEYFNAAPAGEFPALVAARNREKLKTLRDGRPQRQLKPGK
jgi:hypothetical protein